MVRFIIRSICGDRRANSSTDGRANDGSIAVTNLVTDYRSDRTSGTTSDGSFDFVVIGKR